MHHDLNVNHHRVILGSDLTTLGGDILPRHSRGDIYDARQM